MGRRQSKETVNHSDLVAALERIVGKNGVVSHADELLVYEYDGSLDTHLPTVVIFPETPAHVVEVVQLANRAGLPVVPSA